MTWIERLLPEPEGRSTARQVLLARAEEIGQMGSWAWNPATDEIMWSDNLFQMYGLDSRTWRPSVDTWLELIHPDDRQRHIRELDEVRERGELQPFEMACRIRTTSGEVRHMEIVAASTETTATGEPIVIGCVRDVTEALEANRQIAAHMAVVEALSHWNAFKTGAERLLSGLAEALGYEIAVLWVVRREALVPRARASWNRNEPAEDILPTDDPRLRALADLAARARSLRQPVAGQLGEQDEPLGASAVANGAPSGSASGGLGERHLRVALALPAVNDGDVLAVLGFCGTDPPRLDERMMSSLVGIGHEIGAFLARRRGELSEAGLTPRQIEVLRQTSEGVPVQQIAQSLQISRATIKSHFEHIYARFNVSDRTAAVAMAVREGLI